MITIAICSAMIGSMLGLRYRIVVLLPVVFLGSALLIVVGTLRSDTLLQTIWSTAIFVSCVQFGYVAILLARNPDSRADRGQLFSFRTSPKLR